MNHSIFSRSVVTAGLVVGSIVAAHAQGQEISSYQLLHGGSRCDHVIGLMHRHGVNNSVNRAASYSMLHHSRYGAMEIPETELGDLQIVQVTQIVHDVTSCGPQFAVTIRNHSCRKVCDFHVSAVAILGRIFPASPNATVKVGEIGPDEELEIMVQLPIEALSMGNRNGQIIGFQQLVVAIDSFDQLVEANEANNLQAIAASDIVLVTPSVEPVLVPAVEPAVVPGVVPSAVQPGVEQTGVVEPAAVQAQAANPAPVGVAPTSDPLRSAIQKMGMNEPAQVEAVALQ